MAPYDFQDLPLGDGEGSGNLFQEQGRAFLHGSERRTQLVRHMRDKSCFHRVELSQPLSHPIKSLGQLADLSRGADLKGVAKLAFAHTAQLLG